jgi:hypothetical protein
LLSQKHDKNRFVKLLEESNRNHWSVEIEEVEQEYLDDEGIIIVLLILMVLVVSDCGSKTFVSCTHFDNYHLI